MRISTTPFRVNGLRYRPPAKPLAVICIDGCGPEYLEVSRKRGRMPHLDGLAEGGFETVVRGALPSFTNVNNACIVSGVPPSVTGISGNFFLDPRTGRELMMNSSRYVRCGTILAAASRAGRKVAMVTAKEKLRDLLTKDLDGIAFSAERAAAATFETHGISHLEDLVGRPQPEIYSAGASLFVLAAGVRLIQRNLADFLFLSLTDYMQQRTLEVPWRTPRSDGPDAAFGSAEGRVRSPGGPRSPELRNFRLPLQRRPITSCRLSRRSASRFFHPER